MNANESLSRVGPVLRTRGLEKEYGRGEGLVRALNAVELEVASGETLAVMGPSGCGKSTLLHLLGGLERPSAGGVAGGAAHRPAEREGAGTAAPHGDRLRLPGLPPDGRAHRRRERRAARPAGRALAPRGTTPGHGAAGTGRAHRPGQASALGALGGGERQRVAIARALSNEPLVVLADEPTGNLDSAATLDVLRLDGLRSSGQTLLIVTHDSRIAATADRLISMRDGAFVEETRLTHGTTGRPAELAGLEG